MYGFFVLSLDKQMYRVLKLFGGTLNVSEKRDRCALRIYIILNPAHVGGI